MKKKIISTLLCVATCLSVLVGCGASKKDDASKKEKVITVAANGSFFPVIYTDDNGNLTGFEHDVMEEIGKRAG